MTEAEPTLRSATVAVLGTGASAEAAARSLRSVEGVHVVRVGGTGDDALMSVIASGDVEAIAFAEPLPDLPGAIKRTIMSGRHAYVAMPVALSSKQLLALDDLARRRSRIIAFDDGVAGDERMAFVAKMTAGPNALWHPRYIRALRTAAHAAESLDEGAVASISGVVALAGETPSRVSAMAPRFDDEIGSVSVTLITLDFDSGLVARIDVSLIEPFARDEIAVICDGRTVVLDAMDSRAPLQIHASGRHRGPQAQGQWSETVIEHPAPDAGDRMTRAAAAFVAAVRARDALATNARAMADTALVWEAARASMLRGGETLPVTGTEDAAEARRPELQLIRGGGHLVESQAPELTLVRRTGTGPTDFGPKSA
jgi:predicted dehydrogenase